MGLMQSIKLHWQYPVFMILCLVSCMLAADERDDWSAQAKILISEYSSRLLAAYEQAYATGNLEAVADVCRNTATGIANTLAKEGWTIRRISLAALNKDNRPDYTENNILDDFNTKHQQGWSTEQLAWYRLSEVGNQSEFHYIKAIMLEQRCLSCHSALRREDNSGISLNAYSLKRIETRNYIAEPVQENEDSKPLPGYGE